MKVQVYMTAICPRCLYIAKILKELNRQHPELEIEYIDLLTDFSRFSKAGIKVFPAIVIGDDVRSWLVPKRSEVIEFVEQATGLISDAEVA